MIVCVVICMQEEVFVEPQGLRKRTRFDQVSLIVVGNPLSEAWAFIVATVPVFGVLVM